MNTRADHGPQQWELFAGAFLPATGAATLNSRLTHSMPVVIQRSKRYKEAAKKQVHEPMAVEPAVDLLKTYNPTKFDQSVELIFSLGIDPKHADQMIRGSLSLPHGVGKAKRVIALIDQDSDLSKQRNVQSATEMMWSTANF